MVVRAPETWKVRSGKRDWTKPTEILSSR